MKIGGRQQAFAPYRFGRHPTLDVQTKRRIRRLVPLHPSTRPQPECQLLRRDRDPVRKRLGISHPPLLDVEKAQPLGLAPGVPHRALRHPGPGRDGPDVQHTLSALCDLGDDDGYGGRLPGRELRGDVRREPTGGRPRSAAL